jgi:pilus assembly protein CpaE
MQAFIVSDSASTAQRVRPVLLQAGFDCPQANIVPIDQAARVPADAGLVVLALSPSTEKGLAALGLLRAAGPYPVVVVGPSADSRLVLHALRSGAADFVDEKDGEVDLATALGRLRGSIVRFPEPARTIAMLAPSGGSGASTLAVNVASALAAEHKSALLVDLKLHNGDLASLLDLRPTHTLAELCQSIAHMDRTMFEKSLARHTNGVQLLGPPRLFPDVQYVTAEGVRQILSLARGSFPYMVMDLDNTFAPEQVEALRVADVVVLVLRLDFTCLRNARRALGYLEHLGIGGDKVRVVVNRYGQAKEVAADQAEEALGVKIAHYVPEDARTVNRANNNGIPVVLESPSAKVSRSLVNLAASVNGRKHS